MHGPPRGPEGPVVRAAASRGEKAQDPTPDRHAQRLDVVDRLRAELELRPGDPTLGLRLGEALLRLDERAAARQVFEAVASPAGAGAVDALELQALAQAERALALLEEREGAVVAAQTRWEHVLGIDIDDTEAWNHLARLDRVRARGTLRRAATELPVGTLASPAGVATSRYRLVRELGRGASATVYLVREERIDLPLALKVLHPQFASAVHASARARFFGEARLAARVRHPGVVAIYDIDEAARSLTMEYVPGGTLRDRIRRRERPSPETLREIARSLLETLGFVHAAGVIHGDLKPGNILCRAADQLVLADFGAAEMDPSIAAASAIDDPRTAAAGLAAGSEHGGGTLLYLAPEQFRGAKSSAATDLFAVGMILWELATGRPARRPRDLIATVNEVAPTLGETEWTELGGHGERLARLIAALTSVHPRDRPPSAAAALEALGAAAP